MFLASHLSDRSAIIHDGELVKSGIMPKPHAGCENLEDVFVRVDHPSYRLIGYMRSS
jgi:hypothetical protein